MTQVEFARAVGVDPANVSRWETGHLAPRDERRIRIAEVLGLDVGGLFSYDVSEPNDEEAA